MTICRELAGDAAAPPGPHLLSWVIGLLIAVSVFGSDPCWGQASEFRPAENALSQFGAVRHENVYTVVPTTGKLVSIKIADSGKTYYICREENGYAIYHLEIRPMEGFQDKIRQELKDKSRNWDNQQPDELLLTKDKHQDEIKRNLQRYYEAVWVRNEIIIRPGPKRQGQ